jgi:hypothetical protein
MYVPAVEFLSRHHPLCHPFVISAETVDLQEESSMACRLFAAVVVAMLLMCAPGPLAAMEKDASTADRAIEWLSGVWSDFAAWLSLAADNDGSCSLDPNGCPDGAATPAVSDVDGTCALDPDGCPDGQ